MEKPTNLPHKGSPSLVDNQPEWVIVMPIREDPDMEQKNGSSPPLSRKTIRELDKHHRRGVGIRLGPELELIQTDFDLGNGNFHPGYGVTGEIRFSPYWALETGVQFQNRQYDFNVQNAQDVSNYPGYDPTLGDINEIAVETWVLRVPINLKYYYPVRENYQLYIGAGYSPNLYFTQNFNYEYSNTINNQNAAVILNEERKKVVAEISPEINFTSDIQKNNCGCFHQFRNNCHTGRNAFSTC